MLVDLCLEGLGGGLAQALDAGAHAVDASTVRARRVFAARSRTMSFQAGRTRSLPPAELDVQPTVDLDPERIRAIAARLPIQLAWAIFLVDVCGYDYRSAARGLGVSERVVGKRLRIARTHIAEAVTRDGRPLSGRGNVRALE